MLSALRKMPYLFDHLDAVVNEFIDDLADNKGADYKALLGAGTDGLVQENSIADQNRQAVMSKISSIQASRINNRQPPMTPQRAFKEAVKAVTGKDISSINKKTTEKLSKRSRSNSVRSGRKPNAVASNGKSKNTAEIAAILDKQYNLK